LTKSGPELGDFTPHLPNLQRILELLQSFLEAQILQGDDIIAELGPQFIK